MNYFAFQYGLAMVCGFYALYGIRNPNKVQLLALGMSLAFFLSIYTATFMLNRC